MSAEPVADARSSPNRLGRESGASAPLLEISNAMVRLHKEAFGRGPTRVRTMLAGPDTVVVMLEDAFTAAERTLLARGETDGLRVSRLVIQEALEDRARAVVEKALGRRTLAYISGFDSRRGVAVNAFTLAPVTLANGDQRAAISAGRSR